MSLLSELFAFIVVGDARYGREITPLDEIHEKANKGLSMIRGSYVPPRNKIPPPPRRKR